jgi:RHS repeat-associated protein
LGAGSIDGTSYTVDAAGNRTAKTDQATAVTSNYTYDAIYQLLQATQAGNTTESYTYDPVGDRLSSLGVSPYAYNSSNELTSTPNATYTYDYNGNTLTKTDSTGTTQYAWDYENRLTSVTLPGSGGTVNFKYDPFGRRIEKITPSGTSIYAYDGDNLIEETDGNGAVMARYTDTLNIDEPLAMFRAGATSFYERDGLGSVTSLTNAAGALAETYAYDSFGKLTASSGSITNPFQYTGREFDSTTGLYYYRARYYGPVSGRFISEDPISFRGGINFYQYGYNRPVSLRDPSGRDPVIGATVGAIVGGIYGGLGALAAGGSPRDVAIGAAVGAGVGLIAGTVDPTLGLATVTAIGGISSGIADAITQKLSGAGKRCHPYNWGSTAGALVGGSIGGFVGGFVGEPLVAGGVSELQSAIAANMASGNIGTPITALGAAVGASHTHASGCGCR